MKRNDIDSTSKLVDDRQLREAAMDRLEVLDKVKALFLIPQLNMATSHQVAEYFGVSLGVLRQCVFSNKEELALDGVRTMTIADFQTLGNLTSKKTAKGRIEYEVGSGNTFVVNTAKTTCYSKRAVLRIAMLLRDSLVAQEIRTQLLNTFENASVVQKTYEIGEEEMLLLQILTAKSVEERTVAISAYRLYTNRHVSELEETNRSLENTNSVLIYENEAYSRDAMLWKDRSIVDRLIKIYAGKKYWKTTIDKGVSFAWNIFYSELFYDNRIALRSRWYHNNKKGSSLDYVSDHEWPILVRKAFAMCRRIGCHVEECLNNDVVYHHILEYARDDLMLAGDSSTCDSHEREEYLLQ